jgi:hypothetical protein
MTANKKQIQEILPWSSEELEDILIKLISHGSEAAKVDFKTEIIAATPEQKAELLKDIVAIVNTYDDNYNDYGFIIYGVAGKIITGATSTETNVDKFQNHIEQLLKNYIYPMPQIYVVGFETTDGKKWGAIIMPPQNSKPHMFFKELSCVDKSCMRKKGDWFVRKGATTDHGLPEDLALITQKQMEISLEPLKESIRTIQVRISKVEDQYNSALFKLVGRAFESISKEVKKEEDTISEEVKKEEDTTSEISLEVGDALGIDLPNRLKQKLKTPTDKISDDIIAEAKKIREIIDSPSSSIPWTPQLNNVDGNKKIIEEIEELTRSFRLSAATILLNDKKGIYTETLLRAIRILARIADAPSGTSFNRIGEAIRYYPIGLIIYTIFICGVAMNRQDILKKILDIPLRGKRSDERLHILDTFFSWYEAKSLFNDAFGQRLCAPIASRIRQIVSNEISELLTEFSEPECFFRGEFILALSHIDQSILEGENPEYSTPLAGLYLYLNEASDIIKEFLTEQPEWFDSFYKSPVDKILELFDQNAHKMVSSGCIGLGLHLFKAAQAYKEAKQTG